ncbi:MAG: amine oxidase [Rhodospirillaceae bacterium]|nr:amine oxidase [Rhodospirillaceae bacterium]|tara:strand:- start:1210 stop:2544 length:1335 start_codon:yes stop_codon:yes gene_type:complete
MSINSASILQILGGGPGGLATAYYARKAGQEVILYEGASSTGGNARTLKLGDCLFDTGAHRLHDKIPEVTEEIRSLLGADLIAVNAPSRIHLRGRRLLFPLQPRDLLRHLPLRTLARIAVELLVQRNEPDWSNFRSWAISQYGQTLAELLLLSYSEKLWGEDTSHLSAQISGGRLRNLDLKAFIRGLLPWDDARHLDGSFLYPRYGFGSIFDRIAEEIGDDHIHCNSRITRLVHEGGRINAFMLGEQTYVPAKTVVSTLPLPLMLEILDPAPPMEILQKARGIRFRKLLLCVFCLKRGRFSENASIYFPEKEFPFTRLYECKNRSPFVAPENQTAIVLELPCHESSDYWHMSDADILRNTLSALSDVDNIEQEEIIQTAVFRLPFAYPILTVGVDQAVSELVTYLEGFENLHLIGRNATFRYLHTHDLFSTAETLIRQCRLSEQ